MLTSPQRAVAARRGWGRRLRRVRAMLFAADLRPTVRPDPAHHNCETGDCGGTWRCARCKRLVGYCHGTHGDHEPWDSWCDDCWCEQPPPDLPPW